MYPLNTLTPTQLTQWAEQAKASAYQGRVAQRIELLAAGDPGAFAAQIRCITGETYSIGQIDRPFVLMSVVKPFLLLYLLEQYGADQVGEWVGMEPSTAPFNSLEQLVVDEGRPRNPMLNSGAITLAGHLSGQDAIDRGQGLCEWLNRQSGAQFKLDDAMLASVRLAGREPNQALVRYLHQQGRVADPEKTLETYEYICCLTGQVSDLIKIGLLLVEHPLITPLHRRLVNFVMLTCGLYATSADYALRVGLPMKSGISGALLAIVPHQGVIACYSPALDAIGNPVAGLVFVENVAQALSLGVLG